MHLNDYSIISINSLKYSIIIWGYCVNYIETLYIGVSNNRLNYVSLYVQHLIDSAVSFKIFHFDHRKII